MPVVSRIGGMLELQPKVSLLLLDLALVLNDLKLFWKGKPKHQNEHAY